MRALVAQTRAEVSMTLRRSETLLLTLGIPVGLLVFFSLIKVLPLSVKNPVSFLAPGILALAVMSTAMVSLGISTGFERGYGVLKRLGSTPLGRSRLLLAKIGAVLVIELLQAVVVIAVAIGLGWAPHSGAFPALGAVLLATLAFGGLGMLMAGTMRAEATLALANGAYLLLLLLGGMVVPLSKLPSALADLARALPAAALADALRASLQYGHAVTLASWLALAGWALVAPVLAALLFRWE